MTEQKFDTFFHYTTNDKNNICQIQSLTPKARAQETLILPSHFKGFQVYLPDNCNGLFEDCSAQTINLNNIMDTSNVTDMSWMFTECYFLVNLNLSNFNTSNVINMQGMFAECKSLTTLNLSNFDTSNVSTMFCMFYDCNSLTNLNLCNFDILNIVNMSRMLIGCDSLTTTNHSELDKLLPNHKTTHQS